MKKFESLFINFYISYLGKEKITDRPKNSFTQPSSLPCIINRGRRSKAIPWGHKLSPRFQVPWCATETTTCAGPQTPFQKWQFRRRTICLTAASINHIFYNERFLRMTEKSMYELFGLKSLKVSSKDDKQSILKLYIHKI